MAAATSSGPTTTRKILGPLTTTYTAPPICSNYAANPNGAIGYAAQGCSDGRIVDTSSCWPPALISAPGQPYFGWGFYSPGLVCPTGYMSACTTVLEKSGSPPAFSRTFSFQFPLIPGETAVGCCPTGFTCGGGTVQTCYSTMSTGSYLAGICDASASALTDLQYIVVPGTNTITFASSTATGTITVANLLAPMFQINWQSSDRPPSTTSTSSNGSTVPSSSAPTTSSTTSALAATSSSITAISQSGLSTGAIIAIAVVIPIILLVLAGFLGYWLIRRRRRDRPLANVPPGGVPSKSELTGNEKSAKALTQSELDNGTPNAQELGSGRSGPDHYGYKSAPPQELDASAL